MTLSNIWFPQSGSFNCITYMCIVVSTSSIISFLSSFTIILSIFLIYHFKLSPPNYKNVVNIFGPLKSTKKDAIKKGQDESACRCHYYDTEQTGFKKLSVLQRSNDCSSLKNIRIIPSMNPPGCDLSFSIIGHRGAGMNAPENTLAAIRQCASRGCTMVEFDVSLTKDLVPVLFHDDNLLRVMGVNRRVSEICWDDLRKIGISEQFPGERVPTLEEAVETCLELGMRFIIDIKEEHEKLIDSIVDIFQRHGNLAYSSGVVSSFYFRVIYKIRARDPEIVGCMAWRPANFALMPKSSCLEEGFKYSRIEALIAKMVVRLIYGVNDFAMNSIYWWLLGLSAVLVHKDALNMELVKKLHRRGLRVYAWTVNCPVEKQYLINKLQIGYLTDTLLDAESEDCSSLATMALPSPESWLSNNN